MAKKYAQNVLIGMVLRGSALRFVRKLSVFDELRRGR